MSAKLMLNPILTLARRELIGLFASPIGYVVLALFALGSGLVFAVGFAPGQPAAMTTTFDATVWLLVFLAPAISMRLLSEEMARGTLERLGTSPVSDTQVILGKWLAAMAFLALLFIPLLIQIGLLIWHGDPDFGPLLSGLLGVVLVGALYLAVGTFASAATENQIIAFLLAMFVIAGLTFLFFFLPESGVLPATVRAAVLYANVNRQFAEFNRGVIDLRNVLYFVSMTGLFLFLAVKLLESRRWR
ncbi:MAG: ABC transporter permease subunit [Algisphaera sp.]